MNRRFYLLFYLLTIISIVLSFNFRLPTIFLNTLNFDKMIEKGDINEAIIGYALKYFESGYEGFLEKANKLLTENFEKIEIDYRKTYYVISSSPYKEPSKLLENLENLRKEIDSPLVLSLLLYFHIQQFDFIKSISKFEKIKDLIDELEKKTGENSLIYYSKLKLNIEKPDYIEYKIDVNKISKIAFERYPTNIKLLEVILLNLFLNNEYSECLKIGKAYYSLNGRNEKILIIIAKCSYVEGDKKFAKKILIDLVEKTSSPKIKSAAYELLGDYSDSKMLKREYYIKSLKADNENGRVWGKLGLVSLEIDKKKYKSFARIAFNKALQYYPNQPEVKKALKKLQKEIKIKGFLFYVLPIFSITAFGIYILVYLEKKHRRKLEERMFKE